MISEKEPRIGPKRVQNILVISCNIERFVKRGSGWFGEYLESYFGQGACLEEGKLLRFLWRYFCEERASGIVFDLLPKWI